MQSQTKSYLGVSGDAEANRIIVLLRKMGVNCGREDANGMVWYEKSVKSDAFIAGWVAGAGHVAKHGVTR